MAWVPLHESTKNLVFGPQNGGYDGGNNLLDQSTIYSQDGGNNWAFDNLEPTPTLMRIIYQSYGTTASDEDPRCSFIWYDDLGSLNSQENVFANTNGQFGPSTLEIIIGAGNPVYYWQSGGPAETGPWEFSENYIWLIEVWEDEGPEPEPAVFKFSNASNAYELDRGWSFDGQYIPHFLELNWFFGEDPVTYKSVSKIRIHGLVKGVVNLQVQLSGMQGDVATDYIEDYMEPEFLDFPFTPIHVQSDFVPATNYVDYSDRGIALQMKFEGRNRDITLPEPAHVIQVLALQSSPTGNGKRAQ